jgi:hypothetical protein
MVVTRKFLPSHVLLPVRRFGLEQLPARRLSPSHRILSVKQCNIFRF